MLGRRSRLVWVANAGLVLGALVLIAMLWTGGASLDPGRLLPDELPFFPVLIWLGSFAALRLFFSQRTRGLEGRCVAFFARRGMPPRDAPATVPSAACSGAFIGAGFGVAACAGDALRVVLATSHPGPSPLQAFAVVFATLGSGAFFGGSVGALLSLAVRRLSSGRRFEVGRATLLCLLPSAPLVAALAPWAGPDERAPHTLLAVTGGVIATAMVWFFLAPIAVARARNHQWGLAAVATSLIAFVCLVVLLGAFGPLGSLQSPAEAEDAAHPNVLLVSVAGLRADFVGVYGSGASSTPHLDSLALRGGLFASAMTPSSKHTEASQSMLTGRYPEFSAGSPNVASSGLADLLSAYGYRTAAFVSCRCVNRDSMSLAGSFDSYDDLADLSTWLSKTALARAWVSLGAGTDPIRTPVEAVTAFRDWVSAASGGPWFAWVEIAAPSRALPIHNDEIAISTDDPSALLQTPLAHAPTWADAAARGASTADWWRGYAESVIETDDAIGALLETLAQRGELHRTVVIVVSVHGMPLGESGHWFDAAASDDDAVLRVPWIVAGPGVGGARRVHGPCSLVDVAPTLLGLLGLRGGGSEGWEGEDLSGYLREREMVERSPHSGPVFARVDVSGDDSGAVLVARYGPYRLVRHANGKEQLTMVAGEEPDEYSGQNEPIRDDGRIRNLMSELLTRHISASDPR